MNRYSQILMDLEESRAIIAKLERAASELPQAPPSLLANIRSHHRRKCQLEDEFSKLTHENFEDICAYGFSSDDESGLPKLLTVGKALVDWQLAVTTIYDALKNGPKIRASYTSEIFAESAFGLAYTAPGSIQFVMTLPNERLIIDTPLDRAIELIFKIAKADSPDQIAVFAREVGVAGIRKVYQWARDHVDYNLNADIKWKRHNQVRSQLFIQTPEMDKLTRAIDEVSDTRTEMLHMNGRLVGCDLKTRVFHLEFEKGVEDIKGGLDEGFRARGEIQLDKRYDATIRKTTTIRYSIEKEEVKHFLVYLE